MAWFRKRRRRDREAEAAFVEHVFSHWEGLFRYAVRLSGDEHTAEDLVQESLTKAYRAFDRCREDTNYRAWIFTILRNTFLSRARRTGRELPLEDPVSVADEGAANLEHALVTPDDGWRHGFEDEVLAALGELAETQRTAVVLCDVEGLTYDEISHVLGCPIGTVRSRIHHARRRLRATLAGYANARGYANAEQAG